MKSIVSILSRYILALCFSSVLIFGGITVYFMITDYQNDMLEAEDEIIGSVESSLVSEVSRIQNLIDFTRSNAQSQAVKNIKSFIEEAHSLSVTLYEKYRKTMPEGELKTLIKETLRGMVHHYEDSYLFILGMDGIEQLNSDRPEMEQRNILNMKTHDGRFIVRELIALVKENNEGFIDYLWTKPGVEGNTYEKKSYIKFFKPYQWIIGTGSYQDTIKKLAKAEVLNRLSSVNVGKNIFLFIGTYTGKTLLGPLHGRNSNHPGSPEEMTIIRKLIALSKKGGGFLTYTNPLKPLSNMKSKNLSYCTAAPEWQWYIGAGTNIDALENQLNDEKDDLWEALMINISSVCALLFVFSIAILVLSGRFKRILADNFNSFDSFFRKCMGSTACIDRSQVAFSEFDQMAELANSMIESREAARKDLLKSEITYREIFNSTKDAIAVMDTEKRIFSDVNQAFLDFFGMSRAEAIGMEPEKISFNTPPYDKSYTSRLFKKASTGETVHFEWMVKKSNGEPFWTDNLARIATIGGKKKLLIVMRDVTERKKMQKIMVQTEKMMSVGGLAAGMAHEINNPLGVIMQVTQNILRRTSPNLKSNIPVAQQCGIDLDNLRNYMDKRGITNYLHNIQDAGQRAAVIVRSMLDFSRKSNSSKSSCDIESVIETAISLASNDYNLKKQYDFKKIKIIRDYSSPPMFNFTEIEISQVILNLIKNAAQALSSERNQHKVPTITIRTSTEKHSVKVEIEDNGPGIPQEDIKRVFEPFYSTRTPGLGTGLGLSVSYFIITQNHGGSINAESTPGEGTRFTIVLPML